MLHLVLAAAAIIGCDAPSVHDGDTLRCGGERVRLFGVDAPEVRRGDTPAQPLAYEARDELIRLARGRVGCRFVERDRYDRSSGGAGPKRRRTSCFQQHPGRHCH